MKVAVYSPLPPSPSGIADYAAELLPHLARHAELSLVVERGQRIGADLARWPRIRPQALPAAIARGEIDLPLYHLGDNCRFHAGIWRSAKSVPGVVVLHELALHHLVRDLTLHRGDAAAYVAELALAGGEEGARAARQAIAGGIPLDGRRWPLCEALVDRSLAVLVHSEWARGELARRRPAACIETVRHHLSLPRVIAGGAQAARARLGLEIATPIVASFGAVAGSKRPGVLLRAFRRLRRELPEARLLFVGEVSGDLEGTDWLRDELAEGVEVVGRTDFERFVLTMQAADVAVNLRSPGGGETSGTLVRLLGLGKPVVVSNAGAFAEIPDACCAKVDLDSLEEETLAVFLAALLRDESLRRAMGENARRWCTSEHAIERSAARYAEVLQQALARRARAGGETSSATP